MRLGSKILCIGIVFLILGAAQPAVHTSSEYRCNAYDCETHTTYETNDLRNLMLVLGGIMVSSGLAGWIGTYDADRRAKRRHQEWTREQEERNSTD